METIVLETGVILGLTSVLGKFVSDASRDKLLPLLALLLGVGAVLGMEGVSVALAFKGVVLGGTVTGLYATTKDMLKSAATGTVKPQ